MISETVGELETAKELHRQRLDQHDSAFVQIIQKLDLIHNDFQQRLGAEKAKKYEIWVAFSALGLLFTAVNLFGGG